MSRLHAYVSGKVQGVFFRKYTSIEASKIGDLTGYVKNLPDGRVEVVAEGERASLESLLAFLHKGSPKSKVTHVEERWESYQGTLRPFSIDYAKDL
jgi:acylphosphatase